MTVETLKAPFPWFGGKSRVADIVWERFGNVPNYVEPFAGSLAVLLGRPSEPHTETVNDKDAYLSNFWRAVALAPQETASHADWPVSEADLLARHRWLMSTGSQRLQELKTNPEFYDPKVAGWWVWGLCSWIGSGWCVQRGEGNQPTQIPHLGNAGRGINRKLSHLGSAGRGSDVHQKRPHLMTNGKGINAIRSMDWAARPALGTNGQGINAGRISNLLGYFEALSNRLRSVRICCGEWDRVLGESVTIKHGVTGVFLDPPYSSERADCYSVEDDCSAAVREWAITNGNNTDLRIALCGYDGEHVMPDSWACVPWKARGGYGSQSDGRGRDNSAKERIWFSPHCLKPHEFLFT